MAARIESKVVEVAIPVEQVFKFLTDFNNFKKLMPDQVTNWSSTENECSFIVSGIATLGMKIIEKVPHSLIKIESLPGKIPFTFNLLVQLESGSTTQTKGQLIFESEDMNPMVKMMVEKPLSNFFNMLADKMKDIQL